jgi:ribonuclease HI
MIVCPSSSVGRLSSTVALAKFPMNVSPHYMLFSESSETTEPGRWRFVLRALDGSRRLVVDEVEPEIRGERLELLTVVRGLESLDEPSSVTLVTRSTYIREGIRYGVSEWRKNGWRWESFGRMVPVKNADLWQRVDRAMQFHRVECRVWRFDRAHDETTPMGVDGGDSGCPDVRSTSAGSRVGGVVARPGRLLARLASTASQTWRGRICPIWATLVPSAEFGKLFYLERIANLAKVQKGVRYRCAKHPAGRFGNGT